MAVIKAVSSKAGIGHAIDYVTKKEKTEEKLVSGLHCEPETVKEEMQATKELWGKTAYENQVPVNAIRNHAPTHQMLIIGAGQKDTTSIRNVKTIASVAAKAGMRVAAVESSGNAHDWHAVQDVLRYGLAVFGHDTGLDGANPNLSDYPNLKRITI